MEAPLQRPSLAEYLVWEAEQAERSEFWRGEVFAMAGAKRGHGRVIANLMRHLGNHLDGTPCQAFSENMKVQVRDEAVLYPDVFVTCDREFSASQAVFTTPLLIVEVLSPSTQGYDRSRKFAIYRRIESLREYALVDPDTRRVEVYRLGDDGLWSLFDMSDGPFVELATIDARIALDAVFDGMGSA